MSPEGTTLADWRIAGELAARFGVDFDLELVHEIQDEIARVAPAFAGVDARLLERARDGVMLPLAEHHAELVLDAEALPVTDASWEPIQPGTIASEEGVSSHMGTGVVESSGTGSSTTVKPGLTETEAPGADPEEAAALAEAARAALVALPGVHEWDGQAAPRDRRARRRVRSPARVRAQALRRGRRDRALAVAHPAGVADRAPRAPGRP